MSDEVDGDNENDNVSTIRSGAVADAPPSRPSIAARISGLEVVLYDRNTIFARTNMALTDRLRMMECDVWGEQVPQGLSLEESVTGIEQELGPLDILFQRLERYEEAVRQHKKALDEKTGATDGYGHDD